VNGPTVATCYDVTTYNLTNEELAWFTRLNSGFNGSIPQLQVNLVGKSIWARITLEYSDGSNLNFPLYNQGTYN